LGLIYPHLIIAKKSDSSIQTKRNLSGTRANTGGCNAGRGIYRA
jgi:hypothetical protein